MLTKNLINNLESHKIDKIANLFLFHISTDPNLNKRKLIFLVVVCAPIIIIGIIKYLLFFFLYLKQTLVYPMMVNGDVHTNHQQKN